VQVPEETQLVFRGHAASMDCCCFLTNGEFLSGSDDGSLALWNTIRKKPAYLARNAHGSLATTDPNDDSSDDEKSDEENGPEMLANGHANGMYYLSTGL
jgi:ribosomal RNA-processing protein 9